jgi:predicted RNA binding protein YcfA (HicA-like mRNA interferase family)
MKVRDAIRMIERDGWRPVNQEGSHRQYKHAAKKGRVTIAGHPSMDLDPETTDLIREAIRMHVAGIVEDGGTIPEPETIAEHIVTEHPPHGLTGR